MLPTLVQAVRHEDDADLLTWELRLISLWRDPATTSLLLSYLQDSRPAIRAAAADAIGILRKPTYSVHVYDPDWTSTCPRLDSNPTIGVEKIVSNGKIGSYTGGYADHDLLDDPPNSIPANVRPILERMMVEGATSPEREAAARALVAWPPDGLQFRLAEWGVWISNNGRIASISSIFGDIPPFVHRTGNPLSEFNSYLYFETPSMSPVLKPIAHLTTNVVFAADLEVHIREGRPWFVYPLPDDFALENRAGNGQNAPLYLSNRWPPNMLPTTVPLPPSEFDNSALEPLTNCREGYPWLLPHHRDASESGQRSPSVYNLGLHWQSLIISPTRPSWMAPPDVPSDPKFQWWAALRNVPSSWISNRGEAERFLYYDGPTRAAVPVIVELDDAGRQLHFIVTPKGESLPRQEEAPRPPFTPMVAPPLKGLPEHEGLYIDVSHGVLRGQYMAIPSGGRIALESDLPLHGDAVIQRFRKMLLDYGLTSPEAEGLIGSWTPQFFQTEGRRFVLRMSPSDYAEQCPMQVRPMPTAVVRLGLVLTEFDAPPAAKSQPH